MLRKILAIPSGVFFLLLALNALLDGDIASLILFGIIALWLFSVAFPNVSETKTDDKGAGLKEITEPPEKRSDDPEEIANGTVWRCEKCNSTNMKGSSHGYCLHCQHIMHEIMKQQRPPFMR